MPTRISGAGERVLRAYPSRVELNGVVELVEATTLSRGLYEDSSKITARAKFTCLQVAASVYKCSTQFGASLRSES